ncbi:MAG: putative bifunctional diguanylate cyclase/phosphodiesterase [Thalassospira sp.]|uniref:putative bifunctional diguanylate cyclase/phosphodiesterase n=1 Tax=Thalassospira sp. TaxID=1912094 RepID=UPI003A86AE5C
MPNSGFFTHKNFVLTRTLPIAIAALLLNFGGFWLLYWTTQEADRVAYERQHHMFERVIGDMRDQIAHDQESVTIWDDALIAVRDGDYEWVEWNLGTWMQEYFDHNGLFVFTADDELLYEFIPEEGQDSLDHAAAAQTIERLITDLRAKIATDGIEIDTEAYLQTPGAVDVAEVNGRPAIISAKPIVSDTGEVPQELGKEYIFVALRYLDGQFLSEIERKFLFDKLRFSPTENVRGQEASNRLVDMSGATIGYFIWVPYQPGSAVFSYLLPMLIALGTVIAVLIVFFAVQLRTRIRKQRLAERKMLHMARHDSLTGLPNRSCFNDRVDMELARTNRDPSGLALLFIDLDHFKQVNDTMGHQSGDEMIRTVAARLRSLTPKNELVARVGGDEFTLLLSHLSTQQEAEAFCTDLFQICREPVDIKGRHVPMGMSIGVAFDADGSIGREELIRRADVALYWAKGSGRNRFVAFDPEMDAINREKRQIEHDLREALNDGTSQLHLQFQPLYRLPEETLLGFEALARWEHPEQGFIPPDRFIPVAEETGLILKLGEWALRSACEAAMHWPDVGISVNVSVLEFDDPDYVERVKTILEETGFEPHRLVLEVTETIIATGDRTDHVLSALKELGVMVAIDDFGTGFSSLGRLRDMHVDIIKIDRVFIEQIDVSLHDRELVRAVIDFAHVAGMQATAEGVETEAQVDCLRKIGCDNLQGFYYSRPIDAHMVDQLVHKRPAAPAQAAR